MFRFRSALKHLAKPFMSFNRNFQVAVIGASSPLGQSVSLLLKEHPLIHRLTLYDNLDETVGIAMDLSHIPREAQIEAYMGQMDGALRCANLVVVAGGETRKSGLTEFDIFTTNAQFIISAMQGVAVYCPRVPIVIATEPINFTVPLASKVLESVDAFDKTKMIGVTGVDTMRAHTWVGRMCHLPPESVRVPVICGHSSTTIIPLLSHILPQFDIDDYTAATITEGVRNGESEVTFLKDGREGSTLSSALATYDTVSAMLNAMNGHPTEHVGFVANNDHGSKFFASPVILSGNGISGIMQFEDITAQEANYLYHSIAALTADVQTAESYFYPAKECPRYVKTNVYVKFNS